MIILNSYKLNLTVALLLGCSVSFAQKGTMADQPVDPMNAPVTDNWKPSLVKDGVVDRNVQHKAMPIPWQRIREADVLWQKTVWREIDSREKQNIGFRYPGDENTGGGMFIEILIDAVKTGKATAYSTYDDRFTQKLTKDQVMEKLTPKSDTQTFEDPVTGQQITKVIQKDFHPEDVTKFRIKEKWIFDRNQGKMVVRIEGIAPVKDEYGDDGAYRGPVALFWLSYPEIRPTLAAYEVYNPQNEVFRATWDDFFETRQFSSKVFKVSNALNQRFEDIYGIDGRGKMEALYEAQETATEIFNKEHDMWVY